MLRKISLLLLIISSFTLVVTGGIYAGAKLQLNRSRTVAEYQKTQSTVVAVVNSDEGTTYDGREVFFGEDIINALPDNYFTLVSKEAAQNGLHSGRFGAIVMFPTDFSRRIATINLQRPQRAVLSYELNPMLTAESMIEVSSKILLLERDINNSFSYMYVTSVFNEVHDAQDRVSSVMENDEQDMNALGEVKRGTKMGELEITYLPNIYPEFAILDITKYTADNSALFAEMNAQYSADLSAAKAAADAIVNEAKSIFNKQPGIDDFKSRLGQLNVLRQYSASGNTYVDVLEYAEHLLKQENQEIIDEINQQIDNVLDLPGLKTKVTANLRQMLDAIVTAAGVSVSASDVLQAAQQSADNIDFRLEGGLINIAKSEAATLAYNFASAHGIGSSYAAAEISVAQTAIEGTINTHRSSKPLSLAANQYAVLNHAVDLQGKITGIINDARSQIKSDQQAIGSAFASEFEQFYTDLKSVINKLTSYDPLKQFNAHQKLYTDFNNRYLDNSMIMQSLIAEKIASDNEQLALLYADSIKHVDSLKKDLENAKSTDDDYLNQTLSAFYQVKETTSVQNVQNMNEFARKLPNSRIGSLGNTNIYDFISEPIEMDNINPIEFRNITQPEAADVTRNSGAVFVLIFAGGCVLVALAALIAINVLERREHKQLRKELGA